MGKGEAETTDTQMFNTQVKMDLNLGPCGW